MTPPPPIPPDFASDAAGEGGWPLPTGVIRELAATIALLEARLAIAQLEDLAAGPEGRRRPPAEHAG